MFPTIRHITDLQPQIEGKEGIRVRKEDNGFTIACYMMQDEDTFSGDNSAYALECRGITFYTPTQECSKIVH